jgi:hypothetical protein
MSAPFFWNLIGVLGTTFPLLFEEGMLRDQEKSRSILRRADGVVI